MTEKDTLETLASQLRPIFEKHRVLWAIVFSSFAKIF